MDEAPFKDIRFVYDAYKCALLAHTGQRRKYTEDPYIIHPVAVMRSVGAVPHTVEMLAAAVLHDVVEDTKITIEEIGEDFGEAVAELVADLTDVSKLSDGNRVARKNIDRAHTALASPQAKTIKLADLIDNTGTIVPLDPGFARIYMEEIRLLLGFLTEGDPKLYAQAKKLVDDYYAMPREKR